MNSFKLIGSVNNLTSFFLKFFSNFVLVYSKKYIMFILNEEIKDANLEALIELVSFAILKTKH